MNIRKLVISLTIVGGTALLAGAILLHSVLAVAGNNDTEMKVSAKKTAPVAGITAIRIIVHTPADTDITTVSGSDVIAALSGSLYSNADMKQPQLTVATSGDTMSIRVGQDRSWRKKVWYNVRFRSDLKLAVQIPSGFTGSVSVQTASGDVSSHWSGSALSIKTASGDVSVTGFTGSIMEVQTASGDARVENSKPGRLATATASGDVELKDVSTGDCRIRTASGDVTVSAIQGKALSIRTTSGDLNVSAMSGTTLHLSSTSGEIEGQRFTGDRLTVETTSGDIRIRNITGDLKAASTSGNIKADIVRFAKEIACDTTSGDIRIKLHHRDRFSLVARTHGDIRCTGPKGKQMEAERRLELPCENCPKSIRLVSVSGDIELD